MQEIVEQQAERGLLAKDEKIAACSHIFEEEGARFVKAMISLTNSTEEAGTSGWIHRLLAYRQRSHRF